MSTFRQLSLNFLLGSSNRANSYASEQKHRRFNLTVSLVVSLLLLAIYIFNISVDPYGIFHSQTFVGINAAKPQKFKHDMLVNAVEVIYREPKIIFLGSSRVQWGLMTRHKGLASNKKVYNLALQGVNMYEARRYFEHALLNQPNLEQVIIGLDELMFSEFVENRPDFNEMRLDKRHLTWNDAISTVFSMDALYASQETITLSLRKPTSISIGDFDVKPNVFHNGSLDLNTSIPIPGSVDNFENNLLNRVDVNRADHRYSVYRFSQENLNHFKTIVETCKQKGIDLKVFISPEHAALFEIMNFVRFQTEIENWKRAIADITPVWDFSGYNSITTEVISGDMKYYLDSSHYSPHTGRLILNRLLSYQTETVPDDFGVLMTPANIESHLSTVRGDREIWARNHPDLVELTQKAKLSGA